MGLSVQVYMGISNHNSLSVKFSRLTYNLASKNTHLVELQLVMQLRLIEFESVLTPHFLSLGEGIPISLDLSALVKEVQ